MHLDVRPLKRFTYIGLVTVIILITVAACNAPATPTSTSTPKVISTRLTAEAHGRLLLVSNCLRLDEYPNNYLLVWPPDYQVRLEKDTLDIFDNLTGNHVVWHIGEAVVLGGGEVSRFNNGERPLFSADCGGPYWLVGDVEASATTTPISK